MDHVAEPLHILLEEKEGMVSFNIICLKLYQFERTSWWCLFVLESVQKICLEIYPAEKISKNIMGSRNFRQGTPLGGRPDENSGGP